MVLDPKFSNDEISILIPKSVIEKEEEAQKLALVGRFMQVQSPLDMIQTWIKAKWSTKGWVSLVALPREFLLLKF